MKHPSRLGRYERLEPIGHGAMGAVYKGWDPALDRAVAVKVLGDAFAALPGEREEWLERFRREARAAARLNHPHVVAVYDFGVDEESATPFIVMEYVPGVSLATLLDENARLRVDQALELVEQIGSALEDAHRHGIVHRDVKPGNVFVDAAGRAKVGEPFEGETREAIALAVVQQEPESPRRVRPEVPEGASRAVLHALAKDPLQRAPSVAGFLAELRAPEHTLSAGTVPAPLPKPASARWRRVVIVAGVVLGAAALGLLGYRLARDSGASKGREKTPAEAVAPEAQAPPSTASTPRPTERPRAAPDAGRGRTPRAAAPAAGRQDRDETDRERLKKEEERERERKKKEEEQKREAKEKRAEERKKRKKGGGR